MMIFLRKMFIPGEFYHSREIEIVHDRDVKYEITAGRIKSSPREMIAWMFTGIGYLGTEIGDTSRECRLRLNFNHLLTGILIVIKDSSGISRDDLVSEFNLTFWFDGNKFSDMRIPEQWCSPPPKNLLPFSMKGKFYYLPLHKKINFTKIDNATLTICWKPDILHEEIEIHLSDFHDNQICASILMGLAMS